MSAAQMASSDAASADAETPPVAGLFCSREERAYWEHALTEALQEVRQRVGDGRVAPAVTADVFRGRLAEYDFQNRRSLSDTIPWVIEQMTQGIVQVTHPRYFGLFNPAPSLPSELAERISAAFNPQLATSTTSPAAIEIERHVIRSIAERVGLPAESAGHFATGGSEANFTALICALTRANAAFVDRGIMAFGGTPSFYVSEDAHLAWYKIAVQCGIGHAGVRPVPTDMSGRMDPTALSALIEDDKRLGFIPVMIAATAGTTGAGMIDPLHACAEIAISFRLWYHVDAAWGGAVIASQKMRGMLAGLERADSVTIDAHKWLATTMACSIFITRDSRVLKNAFFVDSYFMPPSDQEIDPHLTTVQWSRRFIGLRLFLSLATVGWQGHGDHVERSVALADLLARTLVARGWEIPNGSQFAVVCAIPPEGFPPVRDIARAVVASGRAWVSSSKFKGRDVLRMCMTNGHSTPSDVVMLAELLDGFRLSREGAAA
jgi:glutamate/tyrosine decarboxylase-like PLP-dependent enzyme